MKLSNYLMIAILLSAGNSYAQTDTIGFNYQKPLFDFDYAKPVFKLEGEQLTNTQRYLRASVLSGYREEVKPIKAQFGMTWEIYDGPAAGTRRVAMYNLSVVEMLSGFPVNPSKVVLEVKDPSKYMYQVKYGDKQSWMRKNAWCYEYIIPRGLIGNQVGPGGSGLMVWQADLQQQLGVTFSNKETRKINVFVLSGSNLDHIKSKEVNTGGNGIYDQTGKFKNIPLAYLSTLLNDAGMPPVINETGYAGPVNMELNITDWTDIVALRKSLQQYGLDLKEELREVKGVIVIKEIN